VKTPGDERAVPPDAALRGYIAIMHTSFIVIEDLTRRFKARAPSVVLRHVVEDGLLDAIIAEGGVDAVSDKRIVEALARADSSGCDLVFSQCSSVGDVASRIAPQLAHPLVRIDRRMVEQACAQAERIGVLATLPSTLGPTRRLVEETAAARLHSDAIEIEAECVPDAFSALQAGDQSHHDALVGASLLALSRRVDVVLCAQGSMASAVAALHSPGCPIFTSPDLGVEDALDTLRAIRSSEG
jgi:hypothetical protein